MTTHSALKQYIESFSVDLDQSCGDQTVGRAQTAFSMFGSKVDDPDLSDGDSDSDLWEPSVATDAMSDDDDDVPSVSRKSSVPIDITDAESDPGTDISNSAISSALSDSDVRPATAMMTDNDRDRGVLSSSSSSQQKLRKPEKVKYEHGLGTHSEEDWATISKHLRLVIPVLTCQEPAFLNAHGSSLDRFRHDVKTMQDLVGWIRTCGLSNDLTRLMANAWIARNKLDAERTKIAAYIHRFKDNTGLRMDPFTISAKSALITYTVVGSSGRATRPEDRSCYVTGKSTALRKLTFGDDEYSGEQFIVSESVLIACKSLSHIMQIELFISGAVAVTSSYSAEEKDKSIGKLIANSIYAICIAFAVNS